MPLTDKDTYAWLTDAEMLSIIRGYGNKQHDNLSDLQLKIKWKRMANSRRTRIIQMWEIYQRRFDQGGSKNP